MRIAAAVAVAIFMGACSGGRPPAGPTSPTPTLIPDPTFTVSGVVVGQTPTGSAPVEGVNVFVAGRSGITNGDGYYSLSGVPASYGGVSAVKAGFAAAREILTVKSDTRFDFQLGPRVAIYTLSGVVSEETPAGRVPIEGVLVDEYSCEDVSPSPPFFPGQACPVSVYQTTRTDKKGLYSFSGLYSGKKNDIAVSKEGFEDPLAPGTPEGPEDPNLPEGGRSVTINGDTRYDIQLVRR